MKIENAKDYLKYRAIVLSNEHSGLSKEYENNKLHIIEIRKKIDEIKNVVDEGFEMFSPKAAQEKSFNKQEVKELQMRLILLVDDNKELQNKIELISNELNIINQLLVDCNDSDKISNSSCNDKGDFNISDEICKKLKFCAEISESDPRRVKNELLNLLNNDSENKSNSV